MKVCNLVYEDCSNEYFKTVNFTEELKYQSIDSTLLKISMVVKKLRIVESINVVRENHQRDVKLQV